MKTQLLFPRKLLKKLKICRYVLLSLLFFCSAVNANCFVIKELGANSPSIIEGACSDRVSPCSSFKIALALMGFESGILKTAETPSWPFKPEYQQAYHVCIDKWKVPHTPTLWMKNSCIWYSQVLTKTLGFEKFKSYVELFNYGNQDVSGDPGKNNGLTHAWLSSSLKISPLEQVEFISKILRDQIPVATNAVELTKQILWVTKLNKHWDLYGKTGSGYQLNADGTYNKERQIGWFVGWAVNSVDNKRYVFAYLLQDQAAEKVVAGLRAREQAEAKIKSFIKSITKT